VLGSLCVLNGVELESWRAKAIELFPDLKDLVEQEPSPLSLWIELYLVLARIYDRDPVDEDRIRKIYDYASWCFAQPETGSSDTDASSGVAVSFVESIPLNQRISEDLHRWMSVETFDGCENLFRYTLDEKAFQDFSAAFHRRKRESGDLSGI
jgi:hypothetical protein